MKLSEFKREMIADLENFAISWLEGNVADSQKWPLEMPPGDWYDQFLIYESNKGAGNE